MGLAISELLKSKEIEVSTLSGKVVVIDTFNLLYQFLTTIRQRDGSLLIDSHGHVTSHLTGLFNRTTNFLKHNLKLVFVFDGVAPDLKMEERKRRKELKQEAQKKYRIAEERGDFNEMKKYASRTTRLTKEMIEDAKILITAFGCPIVQAPSEGEAQAAYIVRKEHAYATISQDFDTLLYGTQLLIRNLSVAGKRKKGAIFVNVRPEEINLADNLNLLGIDLDQLTVLAMLVGTDYNIGGIKGIGPKKALEHVKKYGKEFDDLFEDVRWGEHFDFPWTDVYYLIKNMKVTDDYNLEWQRPDIVKIKKFLCDEREFLPERVDSALKKFDDGGQKGLGEFF